jgi:hypothetical protein
VILILPGNRVSLVGCRPGILAVLPLLEAAWAALGYDCLVTSGTDGKHGPGSLHPAPHGLALDSIGVRAAPELEHLLADPENMHRAADLLRRSLPSSGFDVVVEVFPENPRRNHLHVERDPNKRPVDVWERGA